jgi:hypothetical protein
MAIPGPGGKHLGERCRKEKPCQMRADYSLLRVPGPVRLHPQRLFQVDARPIVTAAAALPMAMATAVSISSDSVDGSSEVRRVLIVSQEPEITDCHVHDEPSRRRGRIVCYTSFNSGTYWETAGSGRASLLRKREIPPSPAGLGQASGVIGRRGLRPHHGQQRARVRQTPRANASSLPPAPLMTSTAGCGSRCPPACQTARNRDPVSAPFGRRSPP